VQQKTLPLTSTVTVRSVCKYPLMFCLLHLDVFSENVIVVPLSRKGFSRKSSYWVFITKATQILYPIAERHRP
jgi:hypothetical protein